MVKFDNRISTSVSGCFLFIQSKGEFYMHNAPKRILAVLLSVVMALSLIPSMALTASAMQVLVEKPDGKTISIEVEPTDSIDNLKAKIQEKEGIPPDQQLLYLGDRKLEDGHTLADYDVQKEDVITVVLRSETPKAINLAAGGVLGAQQSSVWFGNYKQSSNGAGGYNFEPVKWRVLSNDDGKMLLLADQNLDVVQYHDSNDNVTWESSKIRAWLNGYEGHPYDDTFAGRAFTERELSAIADSTLENPSIEDQLNGTSGGNSTTDKVFLLSFNEAMNTDYGFTADKSDTNTRQATKTAYAAAGGHTGGDMYPGETNSWWLRSTSPHPFLSQAAFVSYSGRLNYDGGSLAYCNNLAVRPAVNVDLGQVLFASAVGSKPTEIVTNDGNRPVMSAVSDYNGSDWKLTVLDSSRSDFYADCRGFKNGTCVIGYAKAKSTINDVISGMIVDADGNVKYYGVLGYANPAPLTVFPFDVSGQYEVGDRIYIFNEEIHYEEDIYGNYQTDYSSALIDITPEKLPEGITATIGQTLADVAIPNPEGNTSGTWTWNDPSIYLNVAGEYSFAATFTPSNTTAFETINTNLTVTVNKLNPTYTVPSGLTATAGQTLEPVTLPSGWTWDDASTILSAAGEHTFPATFTPDDTATYNTVSAALTVTVSPVMVEFGSYPQTEVKDEDLTAALNAQALDWQSYGYYSGTDGMENEQMAASDYMQYCDVTQGGQKYRGVRFSLYRPEQTWEMAETDENISHQYNSISNSHNIPEQYHNGYRTDTTYWFRYEPLQWRVLDLSTGLAMCETVIDSQPYNNYSLDEKGISYGDAGKTYYANNYAESSMRQWLNNDFYNTAFTNAQKSKIAETTIDNSAYDPSYSVYDSASTTDKVFLLSYSDVLNPAYGFETTTESSSSRVALYSDYARCQGLDVSSLPTYGCTYWWLRSAGYFSYLACFVYGYDGWIYRNFSGVFYTDVGVRPAITMDLRETAEPNDQQFVSIDDQIALTLMIDLEFRGKTVNDVSITLGGKPYAAEGTLVTEGQYAGLYKYTVVMAPSEIAQEIVVTIDGDAAPLETSVELYCEEAPEYYPAEEYADVLALTAAILDYGQAAEDVLGASGAVTQDFTVDTEKVAGYTEAKFADNTGYVYNASFMALTKPEYRFYVNGVSEAEAYAYNESGVSAAYSNKDIKEKPNARFVKTVKDGVTYILIEVTGVSAENMGETITVTINGMSDGAKTIVFNGYAFAKALYLYNNPSDERQAAQNNFGAALYNYGYAANKVFVPAPAVTD